MHSSRRHFVLLDIPLAQSVDMSPVRLYVNWLVFEKLLLNQVRGQQRARGCRLTFLPSDVVHCFLRTSQELPIEVPSPLSLAVSPIHFAHTFMFSVL